MDGQRLCYLHCSKSSLRHTYGANLFDFAQHVCAQWPHCNAIGTFLGSVVEVKKKLDPFVLNFKHSIHNQTSVMSSSGGQTGTRTGRENPTLNPSFLPRAERGVEAALQRRGTRHLNKLLRRSKTFLREI
jgi:hypothetical protein